MGLHLRIALLSGFRRFQFDTQGFDLALDGLEFGFLALEEGQGDAGFFFHSGRGKQVGILAFVLVFVEVAELDQAFFNQGAQAVVGLAQADAHLLGQLALAEAGVGLQVLEHLQAPGFWRGAGGGVHFCLGIVRFGGARFKRMNGGEWIRLFSARGGAVVGGVASGRGLGGCCGAKFGAGGAPPARGCLGDGLAWGRCRSPALGAIESPRHFVPR